MADDLLVSRAAGLEIGLGRGERRQRLGAPRFGLRHVGARHLADIETVLGRLELLGQHGDVVLAQANDGRVAHNIDVSGRGVEQDRLFDGAKRLTGCLHLRLRLPDGVEILEALEQRLGQLHRPTAGVAGALWECTGPVMMPRSVRFGIETSLSVCWKAVSPLAEMKGRRPDFASATCSSVARSLARSAFSTGLIR